MVRLKELRKEKRLRQKDISDMLGVAQSTYSSWENGRNRIDHASLAVLSEYYDVSIDYILGTTKEKRENVIKDSMIPVLDILPDENVQVDFELIPPDMAKTDDYYGFVVKDDSMAPEMRKGDVLIVNMQGKCESGDIAVMSILGKRTIVRRIRFNRHGIILIPLNTSFKTIFLSNNEMKKNRLIIRGKVTELRRKYNSQ